MARSWRRQRQILDVCPGNVLDLGCGNGALLAKICAPGTGLVPYGVDNRELPLTHAVEVLPAFAANFFKSNIFDCQSWAQDRRYSLAIVMAGRLLEVDRPIADRTLSALQETSESVLFYCYPGTASRSLGSVAAEFGLELCWQDDAGVTIGTTRTDHKHRACPTTPGGFAGA